MNSYNYTVPVKNLFLVAFWDYLKKAYTLVSKHKYNIYLVKNKNIVDFIGTCVLLYGEKKYTYIINIAVQSAPFPLSECQKST